LAQHHQFAADNSCVPAHAAERKAGQFAAERFDRRYGAWMRRVWWALPLAALPLVGTSVMLGLLFYDEHMEFFWGLGLGAGFTFAVALAQSPPAHIERWRQGAEGERATARALRPLTRSGWILINDVQRDRGNIDHVLVGPAGVFVLETKNLSGLVSVANDVLSLRHRVDPDDGYVLDRVGVATRGQAASLQAQLRGAGVRPGWLQPVVVIWADFEQRSVQSHRTLWIHGKQLRTHLQALPPKLADDEVRAIAARLRQPVADEVV
jgi:hypothetical protein